MKQDSKRSSSEGKACAAAQTAPDQAHISRLMLLPLAGRLSTREPTPSATEAVRVENEPMAAPAAAGGRGAELVGWAIPLVQNAATAPLLIKPVRCRGGEAGRPAESARLAERLCSRPTCSLLLWGFASCRYHAEAQAPHAGPPPRTLPPSLT